MQLGLGSTPMAQQERPIEVRFATKCGKVPYHAGPVRVGRGGDGLRLESLNQPCNERSAEIMPRDRRKGSSPYRYDQLKGSRPWRTPLNIEMPANTLLFNGSVAVVTINRKRFRIMMKMIRIFFKQEKILLYS